MQGRTNHISCIAELQPHEKHFQNKKKVNRGVVSEEEVKVVS